MIQNIVFTFCILIRKFSEKITDSFLKNLISNHEINKNVE